MSLKWRSTDMLAGRRHTHQLSCQLILFAILALCMPIQAAAHHHLRVQLKWKHQFQFAGYYAAVAKGFYAQEGLDVDLLEGGPGIAPIDALLAGEVDYAVADSGVLISRSAGKPVVVLANIFQHSPQVIYTRAEIDHLEQLRGKRVMMQHGYLTIEVQAMLQRAGLQPGDYVRQEIGSATDLIDGRTDAWPGYSTNEGFMFRQRGFAYHMFQPRNYGVDLYGDNLITTERELQQHPERAAAFRRATIRGWEYAIAHQAEVIRLIRKRYNSQHKSVAHLTFEAKEIAQLMFSSVVPVGYSNPKRWQHIATVFNNLGYPIHVDWQQFLYHPQPTLSDRLWHYRYEIGVTLLLLLICLLYLYNLQLRRGIQRRTAELANISSEYKNILDQMQDAYYRTDLDQKVIWVSQACERHLGYCREELIGRPLGDIYYDQGARESLLNALVANHGAIEHFEICLRHKDGSRVWAEANSQYYYDDDGNVAGVEGNVRNINERKRAEQESRELTEQLQQAQKMESIGVLAGGIAHDFNNLLVGVMGNAELAMLDTDEHHPLRQYLEYIYKSAQRGADLVHQMLAYSGQGQFMMGEQNLNTLVHDISELLGAVIDKQVELKQELMQALPSVYGDKNQLTQVIMNLITNAAESMQAPPRRICIRTGVKYLHNADLNEMYLAKDVQQGAYVFVQVEDTGSGMDAETQKRIFDPFFTTKETGSGLGLAALLGVVQGHHGAIHLRSAPGAGSCFTIYLPLWDDTQPTLPALPAEVVAEVESEAPVAGDRLVLVVDDEAAVRNVARRLLEREGVAVLTANDGRQGVEQFRHYAERIVLVLMDLTMPEMDGEQAFHAIREIRSDARIILSSGFSESSAVDRLQQFGLAGFIRKPFTRQQLLDAMRAHGVLSE